MVSQMHNIYTGNNTWKIRNSCHFHKAVELYNVSCLSSIRTNPPCGPNPFSDWSQTIEATVKPQVCLKSILYIVELLSNNVVIWTPLPPKRGIKLCKRSAFQNDFLLDSQNYVEGGLSLGILTPGPRVSSLPGPGKALFSLRNLKDQKPSCYY